MTEYSLQGSVSLIHPKMSTKITHTILKGPPLPGMKQQKMAFCRAFRNGFHHFIWKGPSSLSSYCTSKFSPNFQTAQHQILLDYYDSVFVFRGLPANPTSFPSSMLGYQSLWPGFPRCISFPLLLQHAATCYKLSGPSSTHYPPTVLDVRNIQIKMSQDCIPSGDCRGNSISLACSGFYSLNS